MKSNYLSNTINPFKIGDYVKINETYNIYNWYSDKTFKIVDINYDMITLDDYLITFDFKINTILYTKLYLDVSYIRKLKIEKIKEEYVQSR